MGSGRPALRLGGLGYLNVAPLIDGLAGPAAGTPAESPAGEGARRIEVSQDVPARVAERLHRGELDAGLLPSIEYALGRYAILPGIAIACRGPVRSVCLFHRRPLEDVRRVALDTSSRTSVALTRLLLRARLGREPEYLQRAPDLESMLAEADAALVIGDRALFADEPHWDLGQAWLEWTGLPFVFAFWAGRPGALEPADRARLRAACRRGLERREALAYRHVAGDPTRVERAQAYLRDNIVYDFGAAELAGLREFYGRAQAAGLIAGVPELRFYDDP